MALALTVAACSGSGGGSSTTTATSTGPPKPTYTIAKPGTELQLGDISVSIVSIDWRRHVSNTVAIPGTHIYAVVSLRVTNSGTDTGTITPTQFWLLDSSHHEFLASPKAGVASPLIGRAVHPGATVTGTLAFGTPLRFGTGSILVYQFEDAHAIASATKVGLVQFS